MDLGDLVKRSYPNVCTITSGSRILVKTKRNQFNARTYEYSYVPNEIGCGQRLGGGELRESEYAEETIDLRSRAIKGY